MGASLERVELRPILAAANLEDGSVPGGLPGGTEDREDGADSAIERLRAAFAAFRVEEADCYSSDKGVLLGAIETGFASLEDFNNLCSGAMVRVVDYSMATKVGGAPEAAGSFERRKSFIDGMSFVRRLSEANGKGAVKGIGGPIKV